MRERIKDWGGGLCKALGKRLVELTGELPACSQLQIFKTVSHSI